MRHLSEGVAGQCVHIATEIFVSHDLVETAVITLYSNLLHSFRVTLKSPAHIRAGLIFHNSVLLHNRNRVPPTFAEVVIKKVCKKRRISSHFAVG
jgi:hypothetical protein